MNLEETEEESWQCSLESVRGSWQGTASINLLEVPNISSATMSKLSRLFVKIGTFQECGKWYARARILLPTILHLKFKSAMKGTGDLLFYSKSLFSSMAIWSKLLKLQNYWTKAVTIDVNLLYTKKEQELGKTTSGV